MKKSDTQFQDGDTIFRAGDPSHSAFVIVEGEVELFKEGDKGRVTLAILGVGEVFGEMGVFDQSPRSATARAVGTVVVNAIAREAFLASLKNEPDAALRFMSRLVERLRTTNDMLVNGPAVEVPRPGPGAMPGPARRVKPGFLDRLLGLRPGTGARSARPQRIEIRVAPLAGDVAGASARHVAAALGNRRRIKVRLH